jgi:hypothetical protein
MEKRCECEPGMLSFSCPLSYDNGGHRRGITRGLTSDERQELLGLCGQVLPGESHIGLDHRCLRLCDHSGPCSTQPDPEPESSLFPPLRNCWKRYPGL